MLLLLDICWRLWHLLLLDICWRLLMHTLGLITSESSISKLLPLLEWLFGKEESRRKKKKCIELREHGIHCAKLRFSIGAFSFWLEKYKVISKANTPSHFYFFHCPLFVYLWNNILHEFPISFYQQSRLNRFISFSAF